MRKLELLFLVGLATGFISDKLFVSSQSSLATDDLYLEDRPSGDIPVDDEDDQDGASGSGSGDYGFSEYTDEEILRRFSKGSEATLYKEMVPTQPQSTADSPRGTPSTATESHDQTTTVKTPYVILDGNVEEKELPCGVVTESPSPSATEMPFDEDNSLDKWDVVTKDGGDEDLTGGFGNKILVKDGRGSKLHEQVTTENMWERTEVLAAVIACGVVGFLCAVFLLLLLAYRMKKKDEGSYDLGDIKLSSTAYHKAPTKEFYA